MKYITALLALMILMRPIAPVAGYFIHYKYISEKLCENKSRPEMHCNGKCVLKKELGKAAAEETGNKKENSKKDSSYELYIMPASVGIARPSVLPVTLGSPSARYNNYSFLKTNSIFHPPLFG